MHVVAVLRLVADIVADVEIREDGKDIDREWVDLRLNEFDDHAFEEALLLKETAGVKVTAIAIDGEGVDRVLQAALARGADQVQKLAVGDSAAISSRAAAPIIAAAVTALGADLVLTGVQTPEDIFGQLAPCLGATLDWPQASAVSSVKPDGGAVLVQQEFSGGLSATLRLLLPAVVGVQTASRPIRYVAGSKLRQAMGESVPLVEAVTEVAQIDADIVQFQIPATKGGAVMFNGDAGTIALEIHKLLTDRVLLKR